MSEPTVQPVAPGPPAPPATPPTPPTPVRPPDPQRALRAIAWIAGTFSAIVVVTMLYFHFTAAANDPWKSPQLLALRARLAVEPKNEAVKEQIRQLDFQFRHQFRQRLARDRFGAWLLAGGAALAALVARKAAESTRTVPLPQSERERLGLPKERPTRARWTVAAVGGVAALVLVATALLLRTSLPADAAGWRRLAGQVDAAPVAALPGLAEVQANSPRFRGWDGGGWTTGTNYALVWDRKSGQGIAWQSAIPAPGHNSPVIWGDHLFISGGTTAQREVLCYSVKDGRLLWRRTVEKVAGSAAKLPEVPEGTGFAACTTATDGRHVYAIFANGDLAALNFDGTVAWAKSVGVMKNSFGHASSLAIWQGTVIVQLDQGESGSSDSKLLAFDGANGRPVWQQTRTVPVSWATPIVVEAAGKTQIITLSQPWIIAYAFNDGHELWRAEALESEIVPSPIFAGGLVLAISPTSKLVAWRPDGAGDVTKSHLAWTAEDSNAPDVSSPVGNGEFAFTVSSGGMVSCVELKSGTRLWQHDLELSVQASPAIVGDRLFVLGEAGAAVVLSAGREFRELARSELADKFLASPAFAQGRVFLRGETNLYCLGPTGKDQ